MGSELWQAALLGLVQGLTEFLPISSTGHLILVPALLGWQQGVLHSLAFDVALHIGTLAALLAVFWRDWATLARACLTSFWPRSLDELRRDVAAAERDADLKRAAALQDQLQEAEWLEKQRAESARLAWLIGLATLPGIIAGVLLQRHVESTLRSPLLVGVMMVGVALVLAVIDRLARCERDEYSLGPAAALAIGVGQAIALFPGVSRSGSTIGVGLVAGLNRAAAARFSFLLSTPIVLGAVAKQTVDLAREGSLTSELSVFGVGIAAAGLSGYACIRVLLAYLRTRTLLPFIVYRVVAGSVVILLAATGRI